MKKKKDEILEDDFPPGCLVKFKDLTYAQRDVALRLLSKEYSYLFQVLYNVIEDDALTLELIDIFANKRIKFPSRRRVFQILERAKIYAYAKNRNFSKESISILAKQLDKRPSQIRMIIEKVQETLDKHQEFN